MELIREKNLVTAGDVQKMLEVELDTELKLTLTVADQNQLMLR